MSKSPQEATVKTLNSLIHLDYDAIDAYDAAIKRATDDNVRAALLEFRADHETHTGKLQSWVEKLGGKPATKSDLKAVLTSGKVAISSLSETMGILKAMQSNEEETNQKYDDALSTVTEPPELVEVLLHNRDDERKHKGWIDNHLDQTNQTPYPHTIAPNSR